MRKLSSVIAVLAVGSTMLTATSAEAHPSVRTLAAALWEQTGRATGPVVSIDATDVNISPSSTGLGRSVTTVEGDLSGVTEERWRVWRPDGSTEVETGLGNYYGSSAGRVLYTDFSAPEDPEGTYRSEYSGVVTSPEGTRQPFSVSALFTVTYRWESSSISYVKKRNSLPHTTRVVGHIVRTAELSTSSRSLFLQARRSGSWTTVRRVRTDVFGGYGEFQVLFRPNPYKWRFLFEGDAELNANEGLLPSRSTAFWVQRKPSTLPPKRLAKAVDCTPTCAR